VFGTTGEGIVWAVIDSGIDGQHPHFRRHQNLSFGYHRDFTASDLDESSSEIEALVDRMWHGTHSAGLIAGSWKRLSTFRCEVKPGFQAIQTLA
jgi:subtilisin family serine protease